MMILRPYGPHWRWTVPKMSPFLFHLQTIHMPKWHRSGIVVAPWNLPRRPKKKEKGETSKDAV